MNTLSGQAFFNLEQYDRAIEELRIGMKIDPYYHPSHFFLGLFFLGKSMFEQAIEELEIAVELSGGASWPLTILAITNYEIGKKVEAEKIFDSLEKRSRDEYVPSLCFFYIHLIQGEKDKALEWLKRACKERDSFLPYMRIFPVDFLRIPDEPKYQELLKKYGMEKYS